LLPLLKRITIDYSINFLYLIYHSAPLRPKSSGVREIRWLARIHELYPPKHYPSKLLAQSPIGGFAPARLRDRSGLHRTQPLAVSPYERRRSVPEREVFWFMSHCAELQNTGYFKKKKISLLFDRLRYYYELRSILHGNYCILNML
jgi:hypothetical protein